MCKLISLLMLLVIINPIAAYSAESEFLIQPYTLRTDDGKIKLKFHLKEPRTLKINYALPGENMDKEEFDFEDYESEDVNTISFGNQGCGEKIRYRIVNKDLPDQEIKGTVPTYPCPNSFLEEDFVFGFLTDTQMNMRGRLSKVAEMIAKKDASQFSFIVNAGDVIQKGGAHNDWVGFFEASRPFLEKTPFIAAVGNHAYYKDNSTTEVPEYFRKYLRWEGANDFGGVSFNFDKFQLVVYNSVTHKMSLLANRRQQEWLEKELKFAQGQNRPVIFVAHYPPFSSSGFHKSDRAATMRNEVVPLLEKYKVKLALLGHTHIYERSFKDGVHYVVGGPAGGMYPFYRVKINPYTVVSKIKETTFSRIKVGTKRIELVTWNIDGQEIDKLEIPL